MAAHKNYFKVGVTSEEAQTLTRLELRNKLKREFENKIEALLDAIWKEYRIKE
jgi:hypothetical protein